jgi:hypothetical protein
MRTPAAYELIGARRRLRAGPRQDLAKSFDQYAVEVEGQADILITGIPYISPYNVNSKALNPLLVQVMALGYFYHMYRGKPVLKRRRRPHLHPPVLGQVRPGPPPELHRVLQPPAARDHATPTPREALPRRVRLQPELHRDVPARQRLPRRPPVLHVVLGSARGEHVSRVIVVGADNTTVPTLMGWETADTLAEAISMAQGTMGRSAKITMLHHPPIVISDVS